MAGRTIRIGTRGSRLALIQADLAAAAIRRAAGGRLSIEIVPIKTSGDKLKKAALAEEGGKGLFTKEIDEALLARRIDVAVHSAKDLPAALPKGLVLAGFLKREDPRDAFVSRRFKTLRALPKGAKVGTASLRRQAQLLRLRSDLNIVPLRGNVDTRLEKISQGKADATILACAGLARLKKSRAIRTRLPLTAMLPAPGQGAIALEARVKDRAIRKLLRALDHRPTRFCVSAERAVVAALGATCTMPLGALARIARGELKLRAALFSPDGRIAIRTTAEGAPGRASALGRKAARAILKQAPSGLLKTLKLA